MTTTTNKGYTLPLVNADFGVWGTELNADLSLIDSNLGANTSISCAGSSNVTATTPQAQNLALILTGALTGNINFILPAVGGFYVINNQTTGTFTITAITSAGGSTGIVLPQGASLFVYSDATNVYSASGTWQKIATFTLSSVASKTLLLPTAFQRFRLTLQKIIVGTGATQLNCQFSADGGSTFSTSNQAYGSALANAIINSYNASGSTIALSASLSTTSITDGTFEIWPGAASLGASIRGTSTGIDNNGFFFWAIANGSNGANVLMNALKVQISSGTLSGTLILEGLAP